MQDPETIRLVKFAVNDKLKHPRIDTQASELLKGSEIPKIPMAHRQNKLVTKLAYLRFSHRQPPEGRGRVLIKCHIRFVVVGKSSRSLLPADLPHDRHQQRIICFRYLQMWN